MPGFITLSVANMFTDLPGCAVVPVNNIFTDMPEELSLLIFYSSPRMVRCTRTGIRENTLWEFGIARQYE